MQESTLASLHRRHFVETAVALLDWWLADVDAKSPGAAEERERLKGVAGHNEAECALIGEWHAAMGTSLCGTVKYAAALRRLLKEDGTLYHACAYRDAEALAACEHALLRCLRPSALDAESKVQFWTLVQQLNAHATQYHAVTIKVPTHEEIRENIRAHRAARSAPAKPAMATGFDAAYDELMAHLDAPSTDGDRFGSWSERVAQLKLVCDARDDAGLRAVPFAHAGTKQALAAAKPLDERAWTLVAQLNSFAGVQQGIPTSMMGRIESTAQRLAGEIACGKTDLGSLNLAQLGQSVLEGCDASDVQQLASGMGSLLPMLQGLHGAVTPHPPGPAGPPPAPPPATPR